MKRQHPVQDNNSNYNSLFTPNRVCLIEGNPSFIYEAERRSQELNLENIPHNGQLSPDQPVGAVLKLQHRKEQLEMRLKEKCLELKKLCMKEFDLTGTLPMETPMELNESPPKLRRKIVTMYPYDHDLLKKLAQQEPVEDNMKRKALSIWNSCDNLPYKSVSPISPKHNTWTSPQGSHPIAKSQHRSQLPKSLKFFKKRLQ